jgi:predicted nuclease of predicted toxin-antitoxin system
MPAPIRFHLDEHVAPAVASGLKARGLDVTTAAEAGLLGADDHQQLAYVQAERRVMVTHDHDFLVLAAEGVEHPGICYCHQQSRSVRHIIEMLCLLHECFTAEAIENRVEFL